MCVEGWCTWVCRCKGTCVHRLAEARGQPLGLFLRSNPSCYQDKVSHEPHQLDQASQPVSPRDPFTTLELQVHATTMLPHHYATMQSCHHTTMPPCYHDTMLPCPHATIQPCHYTTILPCHHAIMPPCYHAPMLSCSAFDFSSAARTRVLMLVGQTFTDSGTC